MTTLEKIRAELENQKQVHENESNVDYGVRSGLSIALKIIDKYAEQEPCDDAISREAVIEILGDYGCTNREGLLFKDIRALPSVIPQEQTGHWIIDKGSLDALYGEVCICSECGVDSIGESDYCPYCGCRMIEPHESEVRND